MKFCKKFWTAVGGRTSFIVLHFECDHKVSEFEMSIMDAKALLRSLSRNIKGAEQLTEIDVEDMINDI